ncbi:MAG: chloride channel protein [Pseudomonadota bacterium]|nr:chloride channel protein [Pseudomonadota bacterium]
MKIAASRAAAMLRIWIRSSVVAHVGLAILVGAVAALCVTAMTAIAEAMHVAIYGIPFDQRLSAQARVTLPVALAALCGGGLILGLVDLRRQRRGARPTVDPVEANALHGGRLSLRDGLLVVAQTVLSNGVGASVGLEAGYAQIGAALASRVGSRLQLRRQDLRTLLGCGAAGAMAAAFGAPLTGAFYAFELVMGAYSLANAAPVLAAAVAGRLVVHVLGGAPYSIEAPPVPPFGVAEHIALVGLGVIAALLGVGAMRAAAVVERAFRAGPLPVWARPVLGGAVVAALATLTPQMLGAGHGALALDSGRDLSAMLLISLIALKLTACLVSLASGFRGGLFFASLYVGALLGKLYAIIMAAAFPGLHLSETACLFAGMATLGSSIVGAPLTMAFLVLESSGDVVVAGPVLAGCIASQLVTRAIFGYSFSTWRLHLRGEDITGAHDVGWVRTILVAGMMDAKLRTMPVDATLAAFRLAHPLGSSHYVALVDAQNRYQGVVSTPEAHAVGEDSAPVAALARLKDRTLKPDQNIREALDAFEAAESDQLVVTDAEGKVLGALGEAYAARRYAAAVDRAAKGVLGGG